MKALLYKELKGKLLTYIVINLLFMLITIVFNKSKFFEIILLVHPITSLIDSFSNDRNMKFAKNIVFYIGRKELVLSKYLMFFIYVGISLISIFMLYIIIGNKILSCLSPLPIIMLICFLIIPIYFRFGEKNITIIYLICYVFSIIFFLIVYILIKNLEIYRYKAHIIYFLFFLFNLIMFLVSLSISFKLVNDRDF